MIDLTSELNEIAAKSGPAYTEPVKEKTIEDQIAVKVAEVNATAAIHSATKQEYLSAVSVKKAELANLIAQNNAIIKANEEARASAKSDYDAEVDAFKCMESTIWAAIRLKRDSLLRECDWTVLEDSPFDSTQKNEWKNYRKALRDIPQDYEKPESVILPEKPVE